ncbi:MAG: hypothetical protein WBC09_06845, partial [Thermoanaerobaculia bacterium]
MEMPDFQNREPADIVTEQLEFGSAGYTFRSLSWLDYAKRATSICALHYAAIEARRAIEELLFEEIVLAVGNKLDQKRYSECRGAATKLEKVLKRLAPEYEKLQDFLEIVRATDDAAVPITRWDHGILMTHWGKLSKYLHWNGGPADTIESAQWFVEALGTIEGAAQHLWDGLTTGHTGIIRPDNMQPEVRDAWEAFKAGEIDLAAVKRRLTIATPV